MFVCLIGFLLLHIQIVSSQADEKPIYLLTFNDRTQQSEIWEYPIGALEAKPILVLERNTLPIREAFSTNELTHLRDYVKENDYLEHGWAENNPPKHYANGLWRFDEAHLLIRTVNEVQDGYARMGSGIRGLYGYYEYLLVELGAVPRITSFFKIDYHDLTSEDWPYHTAKDIVYSKPLLSPSQSKIAFQVTSRTQFRCWLLCSSVLLMNYSQTPAQTAVVPLASYPSWSPDGKHLAYLHSKCNEQFKECLTNLEIMSMDSGNREIIPNWDYDPSFGWDSSVIATFEWLDNQNFFYRLFLPQYQGENVIWFFKTYNLDTKLSTDFPPERMDDYSVTVEKVNDTYMFNSVQSFFTPLTPIILENGERKLAGGFYPIYNSRFPDRMIFIDDNSMQITIIESGNKQRVIDISDILPENEFIAFIAP